MPGDSTHGFFSKTFTDVKAGQPLEVAASYGLSLTPAKSVQNTGSSTAGTLVPIILVLGAIACGVGLVFAVRRKMNPVSVQSDGAIAPAHAARAEGFADDSDSDDDDSVAVSPRMSGAAKRGIVTASIIGLLVVVAFVVAGQNSQAKVAGATISQTFAPGEACTTAQIPVAIQDGADAEEAAETLFAALKPIIR